MPPHADSVHAAVEVAGGSAVNGRDYVLAAPVDLLFDAAHLTRHIRIAIACDTELEPAETIVLRLSGVTGALPGDAREHRVVIADTLCPDDDTDGDGLPDAWEMRHFGHLNWSAADDPDQDGVSNRREYRLGRNPNGGVRPDTNDELRLRVTGVIP